MATIGILLLLSRKLRCHGVSAAATGAALAVLLAGCSPAGPDGPEKEVIRTLPGGGSVNITGRVPTGQIINFGLGDLDNTSDSTVRLRYVRLLAPRGGGIQVLPSNAYLVNQVGLGSYVGWQGDLPKTCPQHFRPLSVNSVIAAPHKEADQWLIGISLIVTRPGSYHLARLKIGYVADGHRGWQFFYLNIGLTARNDPSLMHTIHCKAARHGQP